MATKLFLRNTTHDTNRYKLDIARGGSAQTKVVTAVDSGTDIQWTVTAGGAAIEWCSEPVTGVTISSAVSVNIWASESAMTVNAQGRIRLYKVSGDRATWTLMAGTPADDNQEFDTSSALRTWTATPTSNNTLAEGERLGVRLYITNTTTMASGTCTLSHDGPTAAADSDTWIVNAYRGSR